MDKVTIKKGVGVLGIVGFLRYLLEVIKGVLIGSFFGISLNVDLYYAGKSIPEYMSSLFGSASYSALLPNYPSENVKKGEREKVLLSVLIPLSIISLVVIFFGITFNEEIIGFIYPNYGFESKEFAAKIFAIFSIIAILRIEFEIIKSYFYSNYKFIVPAALMILNPLLAIFMVLIWGKAIGIIAVAYGVLIGTLVSVVLLLAHLVSLNNFRFHTQIDLSITKKVFSLLLPLAIGSLAYQLNLVIDRIFASSLVVGSISALQYGYIIFILPHVLLNTPINDTLFPGIAKTVKKQDFSSLNRLLKKSLRIFFLVGFYIQWYLFFYREEIISIVYGRGEFDARAVSMASTVLVYYSLGFVFLAANGLFVRILMSTQFKKALFFLGIMSITINYVGDWILSIYFNYSGIAFTTTIVNVSWFIFAYFWIKKKVGFDFDLSDILFFLKLLLSSILAVSSSYYFSNIVIDRIFPSGMISNFSLLLVGGIISGFIYSILLWRTDEFKYLKLEIWNFFPWKRVS